MFTLSSQEFENLRSQNVTSRLDHGGRRYKPVVFTENGVAMLSSILRSERAIDVNIAIMRIFTKLRSFYMLEKDLVNQVNDLKDSTSRVFKIVFERLDNLEKQLPEHPKDRKKIGLK